MRLLVDTDAFCKLGVADLISVAARLFSAEIEECGRLASLPYMLARGSLPRLYGEEECRQLIAVAGAMPVVGGHGLWSDRLVAVPEIDAGEALLLSRAAEQGLPLLSGDLRALRAARKVEGLPEALSGRVVVLEAVLAGLLHLVDPDELRHRMNPLTKIDKMIGICFSPANPDPAEALASYLRAQEAELAPLVLWTPDKDGSG